MPIIFPEFQGRKCLEMTVCGFVPISELPMPEQLSIPIRKKSLIAEYEKPGGKVYVRLVPPFPGDDDRGIHVHFDLAVAEMWDKPPAVTNTIEDIQVVIAPLIGKKIRILCRGVFRLPLAELPPFIRATLGESVVNDIQVRMTAGTLTVRGAPMREISWKILDNEGRADITLEAFTESNMCEPYLVDGLDLLESSFKEITGEKTDE